MTWIRKREVEKEREKGPCILKSGVKWKDVAPKDVVSSPGHIQAAQDKIWIIYQSSEDDSMKELFIF